MSEQKTMWVIKFSQIILGINNFCCLLNYLGFCSFIFFLSSFSKNSKFIFSLLILYYNAMATFSFPHFATLSFSIFFLIQISHARLKQDILMFSSKILIISSLIPKCTVLKCLSDFLTPKYNFKIILNIQRKTQTCPLTTSCRIEKTERCENDMRKENFM